MTLGAGPAGAHASVLNTMTLHSYPNALALTWVTSAHAEAVDSITSAVLTNVAGWRSAKARHPERDGRAPHAIDGGSGSGVDLLTHGTIGAARTTDAKPLPED